MKMAVYLEDAIAALVQMTAAHPLKILVLRKMNVAPQQTLAAFVVIKIICFAILVVSTELGHLLDVPVAALAAQIAAN